MTTDPLIALRTSLAEQLAALRGIPVEALPEPLLDVVVERIALPGAEAYCARPADWEALRHEEGGAGRPIPYWARLWPSGLALAAALAAAPPRAGTRVLELGCGLGLPSIVAARAAADVLATDGLSDAVAFAAHSLALNGALGEAALVDWAQHGAALAARGPFDLVLASDVLYTRANAEAATRLLPRLVDGHGAIRLADPGRANARVFLAAARASFEVATERVGPIALHTLRRR